MDSFDASQTYYYLPLSGFQLVDLHPGLSVSDWADLDKTGIPNLPSTIYGVRKSDIDAVKLQANWVNLKDHVTDAVAKLTPKDIHHVLLKYVDCPKPMQYNVDIVKHVDPNSVYTKTVEELNMTRKSGRYEKYTLATVLRKFNSPIDVEVVLESIKNKVVELNTAYPVLRHLSSAGNTEIADYINLVDNSKGV